METGGRRLETGKKAGIVASKIEKFEDLIVWKEGMELTTQIYKSLTNCKDFGLRDQMQRAEGYERNSNKEFIQHLFIAKGSCAELRTQIYLAIKISTLNDSTGNELLERTKKISAMLMKLIKTRRKNF